MANGLTTFFIINNLFFSNGPQGLPKNAPDCSILCYWVFDNFILADEPFAKVLQSYKTYVLVNNYLCEKSFLSLESQTTFDEILKVI